MRGAGLQLKSERFRLEREADWRRLEALLARVERGSAADLSYEEMVALPGLYRSALSSLSVARAISLDRAAVQYLEGLCARAYFFVYGVRSTLPERIGGFFSRAWPAAVRSLWRETLACFALTVLGAVLGWVLVAHDPDWFSAFVPAGLAQGRDPTATTAFLRQTLYEGGAGQPLSVLATFLFTHNAEVALLAFALGFAFGAPSLLLVAGNGCTLGAFFAVYASRGLGFSLGGWIFIHGVTELFAVTLAGAAGIRIGWALAFPGESSRLEAAAWAGRLGGTVMGGVLVMLFVAGLLEGFGRQLIRDDAARWAIAAGTAVMWLTYFYGPLLRERPHGRR
jgi:uncharacterized membrane protein SpoIIM required for sporulation